MAGRPPRPRGPGPPAGPVGGEGKASEQARAFAAQHGLVLPAGYTFVRHPVRGRRAGSEEPAPEPVRVDARGLATVAALSG